MQNDLRITFHGMAPSDAVTEYVRARAAKLEPVSTQVTSSHVTIEIPHRHQRNGKHFRVRIEMNVPGKVLVVSRDPEARVEHEDIHAAIDGAFDDARRILEDWTRVRRGDVKSHRDTTPARR